MSEYTKWLASLKPSDEVAVIDGEEVLEIGVISHRDDDGKRLLLTIELGEVRRGERQKSFSARSGQGWDGTRGSLAPVSIEMRSYDYLLPLIGEHEAAILVKWLLDWWPRKSHNKTSASTAWKLRLIDHPGPTETGWGR